MSTERTDPSAYTVCRVIKPPFSIVDCILWETIFDTALGAMTPTLRQSLGRM